VKGIDGMSALPQRLVDELTSVMKDADAHHVSLQLDRKMSRESEGSECSQNDDYIDGFGNDFDSFSQDEDEVIEESQVRSLSESKDRNKEINVTILRYHIH